MPRAASATTISAKANTTSPSASSSNCWPKPATAMSPRGIVAVNASGAEAASDKANVESPETYVGYDRAENFVSPSGVVQDASHVYARRFAGAQRVGPRRRLDGRRRTRAAERRRTAASSIASMPATCISCSVPARTASRSAFASPSTARRRALTTASTSTPTATASSRRSGCISWSAPTAGRGSHVRDPIPRRRRPGLCLHLRLKRDRSRIIRLRSEKV